MDIFHKYWLYKLQNLFEKMKVNEKETENGPFLGKTTWVTTSNRFTVQDIKGFLIRY